MGLALFKSPFSLLEGAVMSLTHRERDVRVVIVGLDNAGKTSALYKMKMGRFLSTFPTIGVNEENVTVERSKLSCCDVGGNSFTLCSYD